MEEFNLHMTGDIHAITAANNLLCVNAKLSTVASVTRRPLSHISMRAGKRAWCLAAQSRERGS